MITVQRIMEELEDIAPLSLQSGWDNSGLLVDAVSEVQNILLCLDVTNSVINEALQRGAKLIVSHHPVIFGGLKRLDKNMPVFRLCEHGISCIAMHTNLDAAEGGVNDRLAELFGIVQPEVFETEGEFIGRIGLLRENIDTKALSVNVADILRTNPRLYDCGRRIETLAVLGGSGSYVREAKAAGADCLLTGEVKYNEWLTAQELDISLIEAGHFATEQPVVEVLFDKLCKKFDINEAEFFISAAGKEPYISTTNN